MHRHSRGFRRHKIAHLHRRLEVHHPHRVERNPKQIRNLVDRHAFAEHLGYLGLLQKHALHLERLPALRCVFLDLARFLFRNDVLAQFRDCVQVVVELVRHCQFPSS